MNKNCLTCELSFKKNKKESIKQWNAKKFCGRECSAVSRAILYKGKKLPESTIIKMRGKVPHNKGVFKGETYGSVHLWLGRTFTKTNCEHCSSWRFVEFALKQGCSHEHKRENYLCLCSSCHKKYDYTPERRKNLSNALKGRVIHWNHKIAAANRGRIMSNEQRQSISDYQKRNPRPRNKKTGRFT